MPRSPEFYGAITGGLAGRNREVEAFFNRAGEGERVAVYRNNRAVALADALSRSFPAVRTLVGTKFLRAAAVEFSRHHPPRDPVLALYGGEFPDFLAGFGPLETLPYIAEVARLDRAWTEAQFASDDGLYDPLPEPGTPLVLGPRTRLVGLNWPVHDLWQVSRQSLPPPTDQLAPRSEQVLVWRSAEGMESEILSPSLHGALARLDGGKAATAPIQDLIRRGALVARPRER